MSVQSELEAAAAKAELVARGDMYPAPWNPRTISDERLADLRMSMDADPKHLWARPLMIREDGMVIAGNHRWLAAGIEPAYESLPALRMPGLSETDAQVIAFRDNEGYAVWDDAEVAAILNRMVAEGVDTTLTGFTTESVTSLLDRFSPATPAGAPDPDDAPDVPEEPRSVPGEVYELGPHRLICGSSADPEILARLIGDDRVDVLWTDPPYGVNYVGKTKDALTIKNDGDGAAPLLLDVLGAIDSYCRPGARFYIACSSGNVQTGFRNVIDKAGWKLHEGLVWVKHSMVLGHSDYHYKHEDILYGYKPGEGRLGRGKHAGSRWYGNDSQVSVFEVDRPSRSTQHPTMKPVDLIVPMLQNSSKRGDVVLDTFGGSGSTLIACEMIGRRCLIAEVDPRYADVIRDRYAEFAAGMAAAAELPEAVEA